MDLWLLYEAEKEAYNAYLRIKRGDDLVRGQRVSERRVQVAWNRWMIAERRLRRAGGTREAVRAMLQDRTAGRRVKRAT